VSCTAKAIDLRSDTVTTPTDEMREAMARAPVGDDVYGEDPTVNRLEELAAEKTGKQAGLFLPSGTMANQVAILTHVHHGDEIIVDSRAHMFTSEVGGAAHLAGVQTRTIDSLTGIPEAAQVEAAIRGVDIHYPRTALVAVENTHNRSGGRAFSPETIRAVAQIAGKHGVPVHMDGARVFNAAVALGIDVKLLAREVDSMMFCLSKGLCAPIGSMLVSTKEWIERARRYRKMLGGGMRQAGIIAAAGIVALEKMVDRLADDHANARLLAGALLDMGFRIDTEAVQTNMVRVGTDPFFISAAEAVAAFKNVGVLSDTQGPDVVRLVTHKDVSRQDVLMAIDRIHSTTGNKGGR